MLPSPILLFAATLAAQFDARVPDESRAPMSIRTQVTGNCKLGVSGQAWVGARTMKGGAIQVRDLSGAGIVAVKGALRVRFANGRYYDSLWQHNSLGFSVSAMKLTPEETHFSGGLSAPNRIESIVLGVYFGDGEVCGELGSGLKEKHQQTMVDVRLDCEQAIALSKTLTAAQFEESVRNGLLPSGPYARASIAISNTMLRSQLLGEDGKLIGEYKEWLKRWQQATMPAKPTHPTQSSPRRAP